MSRSRPGLPCLNAVGHFFSTSTGHTEEVAELIQEASHFAKLQCLQMGSKEVSQVVATSLTKQLHLYRAHDIASAAGVLLDNTRHSPFRGPHTIDVDIYTIGNTFLCFCRRSAPKSRRISATSTSQAYQDSMAWWSGHPRSAPIPLQDIFPFKSHT